MKNHLLIAASAITILLASSFVANDCTTFEQFNQGVTYTMTNYSEKGKVESTVDGKVSKVATTPESTKATIDVVMKDGKGKDLGTGSYELTCAGGAYKMDMKSFVSPQQKEAYKDMDMKIEGDMLDYPSNISAGMALSGGTMTMVVTNNGTEINNTTVVIKDRKCEAVENRTTPAGTWECYKISYTEEITMKMGAMTMPVKPRTVTEWFSFKVGAVRTETYKNGKLEGYSELTKFTKPQ